jgi:nicotinate-nucleotide adenylyltransferase
MTTLGLYGGSFDPVHLGHLLVARAALEEFQLDRLFFIPAAQSPFKPQSQPAPGPWRTRLLRLALAGWNQTEVDTQELHRPGPSYSIDTALSYARRFPQARLFWLIGADHLASLPAWRQAIELSRLVEFLVIPRPGITPTTLPATFRIHHLRGFPLAVSSSEIRARSRQGQPLTGLVPDAVHSALQELHPYRLNLPVL